MTYSDIPNILKTVFYFYKGAFILHLKKYFFFTIDKRNAALFISTWNARDIGMHPKQNN